MSIAAHMSNAAQIEAPPVPTPALNELPSGKPDRWARGRSLASVLAAMADAAK